MGIDQKTNQAVWDQTIVPKSYPSLSGDQTADVAIIGAGITGISTAVNLARAGKKVVLLEQFQIGKGTTA